MQKKSSACSCFEPGSVAFNRSRKPCYQYISTNVVNMYIEPHHMCEVVSQAIYGTPVTPVDERESWVQIETPDKYRGWIQKQDIVSRDTPYLSASLIAQVDALWVDLYPVDDAARYPPAITLPFGVQVEIRSDPDDLQHHWISVCLVDGSLVWGRKREMTMNPTPLSIAEMVQLSQRFAGIPYRWGGSSSFGFDCSGFVQTLYRQAGITLCRDAKDQANMPQATSVPLGSLQPGDLVFFGANPSRITHVGMALDSKRFIHATTSNEKGRYGVQVSRIDEGQWQEKRITARRYFPENL